MIQQCHTDHVVFQHLLSYNNFPTYFALICYYSTMITCKFLKGPADKFLTFAVGYQNHGQYTKRIKDQLPIKIAPSWSKYTQVPQFLLLLPSTQKRNLRWAGRQEKLKSMVERMA